MIKMRFSANPNFLAGFRDLSTRAKRQVRVELQTAVKPALQKQADKTFGTDPGPVKKPIDWTTVKQRAAFFASNGFGNGIPYTRSDALRTSWIVEVSSHVQRDLIRLYNPKSYAKYVYPSLNQQRFHAATGWGKDFDKYVRDFEQTADVQTASAWSRAIQYAIRNTR